MRRYLLRKLGIYALTLFVAVTLNWMLPRFMPGDPVRSMLSGVQVANPETFHVMEDFYNSVFGLDLPVWQQYLNYWAGLFRGDLGISVWQFPRPVTSIILSALPWTLSLMLPAIALSWIVGNYLGALAARNKILDNTVLPINYLLTAMPYMWLAMLLAWVVGITFGWLPASGGFDPLIRAPGFNWRFISSAFTHWLLPFLSLFLVQLGGWAIGMRNLIIYELESDYSNYLNALGARRGLVRNYAFRNAMLPQVTGLALQLGTVVGGALVTEMVFNYPGLGQLIMNAINSSDYFLLQGVMLFIVIGVLLANFLIDIIYVLIDPRTRTGMTGATA